MGASIEPGTRVGRYEIQNLLGAGGMGEVYRALDTELRRPAALKFLPADIAADPKRMKRFEQEALAASALNHPNILTVYDIGQTEDGRRYFATELVEGTTLRERLKHHRVKLGEVFDIAIQLAGALVEAHGAGVVHRDLKPENVMVRRDGYVKVLDFGLAKKAGRPASDVDTQADTQALVVTDAGAVMGTVSYMSPEQARGEEVDARTDIWSLGVVLYEMLTGHLPFKGKSASHTIVSILDDEPPPLAAFVADAPESLQEVVSDALCKDRDARFQTAKQMLSKLQRLKRRFDAGGSLDHTLAPDAAGASGENSAGRTASLGATTGGASYGWGNRTTPVHATAETMPTVPAVERAGRRRKTLGAAALVVALAALAGGSFVAYRRFAGAGVGLPGVAPFAPLSSMKLQKVAASGATVSAAISPDGKYAARVVWEAGRSSLRLRQLSTTNERDLVPPDGRVTYWGQPTFSHDGSYVYYVAGKKGQPFRELFRVSLLGGEPQKIVFDVDSGVTLSPDGKRLAFRRHLPKTNDDTIVVVNADGGGEETVASYKVPQRTDFPAWSPDGRVIVHPVIGTDAEGYYVNLNAVSVADRKLTPVSTARWRSIGPVAWLPDASGLVISARDRASLPSTPMQLWFVPYPEGPAQKITNDVNNYVGVSLSADGRTLLAKQGWDVVNLWLAPEGDFARARQATSAGNNGNNGLSWLPDGRLVYNSDASSNLDIWLMNADGSGQKQLTFDQLTDTDPVASPDGRFIAFRSNRGTGWGIWLMNSDGGNARELVSNIELPGFGGQFSPDSRWLYYVARDPQTNRLAVFRVAVEGGPPAKIIDDKVGYVRLSPDGRSFFSTHQEAEPGATSKIYIFPAEGGAPSRVIDAPPDMLDARDWSPDGRSIDYVATTDGVGNLYRFPLSGGKPRPLTDWKSDFIYRFAWSRDGKQLAVSRGTATTDLVLIKDFR